MKGVILILGLLFSSLVVADIYVYIDKNGNKVYTDKKVKGAKKIKTTVKKPPKKDPSKLKENQPPVIRQPAPPPYDSPYQLLRILYPYPDSVIEGEGNNNFIASVTSDPPLQRGHKYHLLVNDFSAGDPRSSSVFRLDDLPQGTYYLAVEILDQYDRILDRTPAQPVHIVRSFVE